MFPVSISVEGGPKIQIKSENNEEDRLKSSYGRLEFAHMTELLMRYFPKPTAKICDIGGANVYAFYFAKHGYDSHLLDLVPRHINQAKELTKVENYADSKNS